MNNRRYIRADYVFVLRLSGSFPRLASIFI